MCDVVLQQTIETTVKEFITQGKAFSAYDITKEVRAKAGPNVEVSHQEVRREVRRLFSQGAFGDNYCRTMQDDEYWKYLPKAVVVPTPASDVVFPALPNQYYQGPLNPNTVFMGSQDVSTPALPNDNMAIDVSKPVLYRRGTGEALRNATPEEVAQTKSQGSMYIEVDGKDYFVIE